MPRLDFHHPPISKTAFRQALPALRWVTVAGDASSSAEPVRHGRGPALKETELP